MGRSGVLARAKDLSAHPDRASDQPGAPGPFPGFRKREKRSCPPSPGRPAQAVGVSGAAHPSQERETLLALGQAFRSSDRAKKPQNKEMILRICMRIKTFLFLIIFTIGSGIMSQTFPDFVLLSPQGKTIPLEVEDLTGMKDQPLVKTKIRLDNKYGKDFFLLYKATIAASTQITGQYKLSTVPLRISVFEISRQPNADRMIRIVATGYYQAGETAEFQTEIGNMEQDIFFITAEAVESKDQLNPYLQHVDQVDNVILKGYSTNLSFNVLKMKFSGKDQSGNVTQVTEDFDWLVSQLIKPVHVISIRVALNE
jgi:hypothetical protein